MVDSSRIYWVFFDHCHSYAVHMKYMQMLEGFGANVQDYIMDFRHQHVKYAVTLNVEISVFMERLYGSSVSDRVIRYTANNSRGVSGL